MTFDPVDDVLLGRVRLPRRWHPATCVHKNCNCYDESSHEQDGDCRYCRRDKANARMADPTIRHPEGPA